MRWTGSIWLGPSYIFRVCFIVIRYCLVVGGENEYCIGGVWSVAATVIICSGDDFFCVVGFQ